MRTGLRLATLAGLSLGTASVLVGQQVPLRQMGAVEVASTSHFGSDLEARVLSGGAVLVNDRDNRRLVLLDSGLTMVAAIADSARGKTLLYGADPGIIIPYRGDTTLFLSSAVSTFHVIDPAGHPIAGIPVPQPRSVEPRLTEPGNVASYDGAGHLVFRGSAKVTLQVGPDGGLAPSVADSVPLLRVALAGGRIDTLAFLRSERVIPDVGEPVSQTLRITHSTLDPFDVVDDWAMLPDGSVAIIRGRDFHIEWIDRTGARRRTPPVAYQWHALSTAEKTHLLDSLVRAYNTDPENVKVKSGIRDSTVWSAVPARSVPDSLPAFGANTTRADPEGRLWIRTTMRPIPVGGPVYTVVNRNGVVEDRVQLPSGCSLAGFGRGSAYLACRQAGSDVVVRAKIH